MPLLTINRAEEQVKILLEAIEQWENRTPADQRTLLELISGAFDDKITEAAYQEKVRTAKLKIEHDARERTRASLKIRLRLMDVLANPKEHAVKEEES